MTTIGHRTDWRLEKYRQGETTPYEVSEWTGNLGLNEGLNQLATLACGGGGADWSAAYIGVGDSTTAASASQTGLQAATNKAWVAMDSSYPTYGTNQQIVFKSTFDGDTANFAWAEMTVSSGSDDTGTNLLRKVESKGTKTSGETWSLTVTVTLS
jgi:hypothetical protein